jgi:4-amino-4-deoxy-L-arabinose transferase-like glycosyltransferase
MNVRCICTTFQNRRPVPRLTARAYVASLRKGLEVPKKALAAATLVASAIVLTLALRAVLRAPLNVDEELTLRIARESFGSIFDIVRGRGGGPFHFWLEHLTTRWPSGLAGLRVPSIVFMLAALPAVALIAEELAGRVEAAASVLLLASAPLAISYSSFGRPHSMLLAWVTWGTLLGLRAARRTDTRLWIAAGAVLGSSIFVHPTAPLYAVTAFGAAVVYARRPLRAWPGALALAVTLVPYYAVTAHALSDRYGVGGGARGRTFSGNHVWKDAVFFVAPGGGVLNWFTAAAALGLLVLVAQQRVRVAAVLVLTIAAPVVFFTVVPTNGLSALFFDRYMLPALPSFLILVAIACSTLARLAWRLRLVAVAVLVAALMSVGLRIVLARQTQLARLGLGEVTAAVRAESRDAVLFGSTGFTLPGGYLGYFTFGRPPNLADRYLSLRIPSLPFVNDDACGPVVDFLASGEPPRHGLWVFWAVQPADQQKAEGAFRRMRAIELTEPYRHFLVVRSTETLPPRQLVELGLELRRTWLRVVPFNERDNLLIAADDTALHHPSSCQPVGVLGDPDIVPNYPLPASP